MSPNHILYALQDSVTPVQFPLTCFSGMTFKKVDFLPQAGKANQQLLQGKNWEQKGSLQKHYNSRR